MRKSVKIAGIFILFLVIILLLSLSGVRRTSFYNEDYFKLTSARLDSLKQTARTVSGSLKAGFSSVNMTPSLENGDEDPLTGKFNKVPLAGYGDRRGNPAEGIHDSIYAKAVAIETGGRRIVFVGVDLLILPPAITDSVMAGLTRAGITRDQVYFSATHTHSSLGAWGPGFVGKQFAGEENPDVSIWISSCMTDCILTALADLRPADAGWGCFAAGDLTRNRTMGEDGTRNNDFNYMVIRQKKGRTAVIGSYSAHSTTLGGDNMLISADYPGYWARKVEKSGADMALFMAGSVGSQSPAGEGEAYERSRFIGEALADSTIGDLSSISFSDSIRYSDATIRLELPEYHVRLTTKLNLSTFLSRRLMPEPGSAFVQAVRLGDMVWLSAPGDFSGEYALQIRNNLKAQGFNSCITSFNGSYAGYIIPAKYFYVEGYESRLMSWFGPAMGDYVVEIMRMAARIVTGDDNI